MSDSYDSNRRNIVCRDGNSCSDSPALMFPNHGNSFSAENILELIGCELKVLPTKRRCSQFIPTLEHLSQPLCELLSLTTARAHPYFPNSLLNYHLLTNEQLDDLARYYHQVWPPTPETFRYPMPVRAWLGTPNEHSVDIGTKRRRLGRFIGLAGCSSPPPSKTCFGLALGENNIDLYSPHQSADDEVNEGGGEGKMEKEWEDALRRAKSEVDNGVLPCKAGSYY